MHNYQVIIIMNFKVQSKMISFTSKILESTKVMVENQRKNKVLIVAVFKSRHRKSLL